MYCNKHSNLKPFVINHSDAGRHIHATDEVFNEKMKQAAYMLNLKPHRFVYQTDNSNNSRSVGEELLYSPADLGATIILVCSIVTLFLTLTAHYRGPQRFGWQVLLTW